MHKTAEDQNTNNNSYRRLRGTGGEPYIRGRKEPVGSDPLNPSSPWVEKTDSDGRAVVG
jgi:hypothetical protein